MENGDFRPIVGPRRRLVLCRSPPRRVHQHPRTSARPGMTVPEPCPRGRGTCGPFDLELNKSWVQYRQDLLNLGLVAA
jgi:hypothetical protein